MIPWAISIGILMAVWFFVAFRSGPQVAMGVLVLVATLFPTWSQVEIAGLKVYIRDITILIALGCYCFHPKATFPVRFGILDLAMLALVSLHIVSDGRNDGWTWMLFARAYTEWCVPYIAARIVFSDQDSPWKLAPWGAIVATILGLYAIGESLTGLHPIEWLFGYRPDENFSRESYRWGLLRPWGPTPHAIYFGFAQLIVAPWAWIMASKAYRGERSTFWLGACVLSSAGIFFSLSRAPILGMIVMIMVACALLIKQSRIPLGVLMLLILVGAAIKHEQVLKFLEKSGESTTNTQRGQLITLDGKKVEYSGTMTRVYLFSIYKRAMVVAGLTGFGTERTSIFPPNIPMGAEDRETWKLVKFVDNSYVLLTLRFGWFGGVLLALLCGISAYQWVSFTIRAERDYAILGAWMASTIVASMLVLFTVWLAHDFKFLVFWLIGTASGTLPRFDRPQIRKHRERR